MWKVNNGRTTDTRKDLSSFVPSLIKRHWIDWSLLCSQCYLHICPFWPWPLNTKINGVHPLFIGKMCAKFDQNKLNGLISIVYKRFEHIFLLWPWPLTSKFNMIHKQRERHGNKSISQNDLVTYQVIQWIKVNHRSVNNLLTYIRLLTGALPGFPIVWSVKDTTFIPAISKPLTESYKITHTRLGNDTQCHHNYKRFKLVLPVYGYQIILKLTINVVCKTNRNYMKVCKTEVGLDENYPLQPLVLILNRVNHILISLVPIQKDQSCRVFQTLHSDGSWRLF